MTKETTVVSAKATVYDSEHGFQGVDGEFVKEYFSREKVFINPFTSEAIVLSNPELRKPCNIYRFQPDEFLNLKRKLNLS